MSSSFTSEIMDDEVNTILLELTPDEEHPRYASLEGWLNLTPGLVVEAFQASNPCWNCSKDTLTGKPVLQTKQNDRSACGAGQGEENHLVLHSAGCMSGVQLIPEVGGPECRPRGGGIEVTGSAYDVPLLQHEELVEANAERWQLFSA